MGILFSAFSRVHFSISSFSNRSMSACALACFSFMALTSSFVSRSSSLCAAMSKVVSSHSYS